MRTLIIDNYDSFTYNLFHMIAEANGEAPVVIMNDEANWSIDHLRYFDNVVISPGPGHPSRPQDFGICTEVIARATIPVLGVCLGFQGMGLDEGASVGLAPEPRHGRLSVVTHSGQDIFQDVPSPFSVVRYHSLAVSGLPPQLEAIGVSEDGVLMAMRHRHRPLWGVQFHPESICSNYGTQIVANFAALTRAWQADGRCAPASDDAPDYLRQAQRFGRAPERSAGDLPRTRLQVAMRHLPLAPSSELAFDALYGGALHAYWLDSSLHTGPNGRFSFMGDASGPLARIAQADVAQGTVTVRSAIGTQVVRSGFFDWLRADLAGFAVEPVAVPFSFSLGWVGYLGYELKAECYADAAHVSEYPDASMLFSDRAVGFDHLDGSAYLLALVDPEAPEQAAQWIEQTAARLEGLLGHRQPEPSPAETPRVTQPLSLRSDRDEYLQLVARSKQAIVAGESYEICLTNMISVGADVAPWPTYRVLRRNNPAPFAAYLRFDELSVLSGSPERFLSISDDGVIESKPIKGTRPRADDAAEDRALREHLRNSEKDRAENLMIVDLIRNDLGTCAETGSVTVPKLFDIESYATVHQMVSTVRATLRQDVTAVDCVRAAFPGGSMTGAPKIRTMQILDQFEGQARGIYSGSLGYFSLNGAVDLNIVIRSLVLTPGQVRYGVGGAITALSDAADEFEETAVKATSLLRIFDVPFPGRVQPEIRPAAEESA
ncbi:para-aminobenzoate synthase PabAB [Janthinobacterium sp. HH01]|uniref:aminodeoxychorismate synthase component I n=1 Tax=Janthinobacterium sp. HH01 TaxID=1198452 RepID=UPI0002AECBAE|nr:aminodeoxychorismate synthase component I [Janthinobacterium sp. HH01]ELX13939.1 para-aminobenzoate synthase PabAB [Janthinobacterium sp. HH01]